MKLKIETDRLVIRSIQYGDEKSFAEMAQDGSLEAIGFDCNCSEWIEDWIEEAVEYDKRDNLKMIIWHIQFVSRKTIELLVRLGVHGTMILSKQVLHIFRKGI